MSRACANREHVVMQVVMDLPRFCRDIPTSRYRTLATVCTWPKLAINQISVNAHFRCVAAGEIHKWAWRGQQLSHRLPIHR